MYSAKTITTNVFSSYIDKYKLLKPKGSQASSLYVDKVGFTQNLIVNKVRGDFKILNLC